jgi:hypothetical protein
MSDIIFNLDSLKIIVVKFGYNPFGSLRGEDQKFTTTTTTDAKW